MNRNIAEVNNTNAGVNAIVNEIAVGITTEEALGVTVVDAPNSQTYTIGEDWNYARVQRVLANLGVTIPSNGKVVEYADGSKKLIFEATAAPQNYGTKGADDAIDLTNEEDAQTPEPVVVGVTTEGALGVTVVEAPNNQTYTIGEEWDYARVQRVLANLGVTIPSTGKVIEVADGSKKLYFEATAAPQNYGTKG
jgi:hypothetical protein